MSKIKELGFNGIFLTSFQPIIDSVYRLLDYLNCPVNRFLLFLVSNTNGAFDYKLYTL